MKEKMRIFAEENQSLRKELKIKQKTLSTYEYLLKLPSQQENNFFKCNQCNKFFVD